MTIYLTEETKEEIITKIAELSKIELESVNSSFYQGKMSVLREILTNCIVLPDVELWENTPMYFSPKMCEAFNNEYPNGIIILKD
jgi:hypothetical protein